MGELPEDVIRQLANVVEREMAALITQRLYGIGEEWRDWNKTLISLASVSRLWRSASRPALFRRLKIESSAAHIPDEILEVVQELEIKKGAVIAWRSLRSLRSLRLGNAFNPFFLAQLDELPVTALDLLVTDVPTIAGPRRMLPVRAVGASSYQGPLGALDYSAIERLCTLGDADDDTLFSPAPNLHSLVLSCSRSFDISLQRLGTPPLRHLHLIGSGDEDWPAEFPLSPTLDAISSLKHLQSLSMLIGDSFSFVEWKQEQLDLLKRALRSLRLRRLCIVRHEIGRR